MKRFLSIIIIVLVIALGGVGAVLVVQTLNSDNNAPDSAGAAECLYCGGCLQGQCITDWSKSCNTRIEQECNTSTECAGNGVSAGSRSCCAGLVKCDNGRCGTSCVSGTSTSGSVTSSSSSSGNSNNSSGGSITSNICTPNAFIKNISNECGYGRCGPGQKYVQVCSSSGKATQNKCTNTSSCSQCTNGATQTGACGQNGCGTGKKGTRTCSGGQWGNSWSCATSSDCGQILDEDEDGNLVVVPPTTTTASGGTSGGGGGGGGTCNSASTTPTSCRGKDFGHQVLVGVNDPYTCVKSTASNGCKLVQGVRNGTSGSIGTTCNSDADCGASGSVTLSCVQCLSNTSPRKACAAGNGQIALDSACQSPGDNPIAPPPGSPCAAAGLNVWQIQCEGGSSTRGNQCLPSGQLRSVIADACGASCSTADPNNKQDAFCFTNISGDCNDTNLRQCGSDGAIVGSGFLGCGNVVSGGNGDSCSNCYRNPNGTGVTCVREGTSCGANAACNATVTNPTTSTGSPTTTTTTGPSTTSSSSTSTTTTSSGGSPTTTTTTSTVEVQCNYLNQTSPAVANDYAPGQAFSYTAEYTCAGLNNNLALVVLDSGDTAVGSPTIVPQSSQNYDASNNLCTYTFNWTATGVTDGDYDVRLLTNGALGSEVESPIACTEQLSVLSGAEELPAFTVIKTSSHQCTNGGATLSYQITARNIGNVSANLDFVEDTLPDGIDASSTTQVTGINPTPTSRSADVIRWDVNQSLAPGETRVFTYNIVLSEAQAIAFSGSTLNNFVLIQYGDNDSTAQFENSITINCLPDTAIFDENPVLLLGLLLIIAGIVINRSGLVLKLFGIESDGVDASSGVAKKLFGGLIPEIDNDGTFEGRVSSQMEPAKKKQKKNQKRTLNRN